MLGTIGFRVTAELNTVQIPIACSLKTHALATNLLHLRSFQNI
jgi:hypothetical protein